MFLHPLDVAQQLKAMPHIAEVREEAGHVGSQEGSETERPESETTTGWSEQKEGVSDERE